MVLDCINLFKGLLWVFLQTFLNFNRLYEITQISFGSLTIYRTYRIFYGVHPSTYQSTILYFFFTSNRSRFPSKSDSKQSLGLVLISGFISSWRGSYHHHTKATQNFSKKIWQNLPLFLLKSTQQKYHPHNNSNHKLAPGTMISDAQNKSQ